MKLFVLPQSPNTIKVLAMIHHLGLQVEIVVPDLKAGETKTPEYLKMNPNGRTPVLVDGDFVLWESNAILQYLALKHPEGNLLPKDIQGQANVTRWVAWTQAHWGPAVRPIMLERLMKPMMLGQQPDEEAVTKALPEFELFAKVLDDHLGHNSFLVSDHLTVADFVVCSMLVYAGPARFPLENFPNIVAYNKRVTDNDAWRKAMPQMPAGASK